MSSLKRKMLNTISQNANPESQMPVGLLQARRPSPNLGLAKLSSKTYNQIQQLNM